MKLHPVLRAGLWALSALITSMAQVSTTPAHHSAMPLVTVQHPLNPIHG